jgi:hypothetical protein
VDAILHKILFESERVLSESELSTKERLQRRHRSTNTLRSSADTTRKLLATTCQETRSQVRTLTFFHLAIREEHPPVSQRGKRACYPLLFYAYEGYIS